MYCGNCGKPIPDDANYCCYCGNLIIEQIKSTPITDIQVCWIANVRMQKGMQVNWHRLEAICEHKIIDQTPEINIEKNRWELSHERAALTERLISIGWKVLTSDSEGNVALLVREKKVDM